MKLDLREIIEVPGGTVPFEAELARERVSFPSVLEYTEGPIAEGEVRNAAGALSVRGELYASMLCVCDRCGKVFPSEKTMELDVPVVSADETEDPEAFTLEGDSLDLDDLLETVFILDMETKFLCREDCRGVCPECGRDLNEGPCGCKKKPDPRLAVLEQLLDIDDESK
ncbi:MAG: DUF177 domain-containing protein [Oscillospiraceae bacterium]|nr:DUF177 domain-containing protein [Oscillospiraceae bacterium]